jgi:hypothetical protein
LLFVPSSNLGFFRSFRIYWLLAALWGVVSLAVLVDHDHVFYFTRHVHLGVGRDASIIWLVGVAI